MMSTGSGIEWTDATWNPVTGCTRVSAGCDNCYAVPMTRRLEGAAKGAVGNGQLRHHGQKYVGLTARNAKGTWHFNGKVRCHEDALQIPLHWNQPRRIFVNSMSDLFHRDVPFNFIDRVFAVMALTPQHTYQVLTKRPERMAEYLCDRRNILGFKTDECVLSEMNQPDWVQLPSVRTFPRRCDWPLTNAWLGTSIETQDAADDRVPHLLRVPAPVRFLSIEPILGPVDLSRWLKMVEGRWNCGAIGCRPAINWVIVGGESGPQARPCYIDWIRSVVAQCHEHGVPCFVKQLGSHPFKPHLTGNDHADATARKFGIDLIQEHCFLKDRKGGDWDEWPAELRIREFPKATVMG